MEMKEKRAPNRHRAIPAWSWPLAALFVGAGLVLAVVYPRPAALLLAPLCGVLALTCWVERRRSARLAVEAAKWQRLLAPYLPELPELVSQLQEAALQLEGAVLEACDGFHGIGAKAREAVGLHGRQGLEPDILRVVVALQFQDIVNQRITHAIETLTELGTDLGACIGQTPLDRKAKMKSKRDWAWRLQRTYALDPGRRVAPGRNGVLTDFSQSEPKDNIELFLPEVGP
jgi:hypothetical protein